MHNSLIRGAGYAPTGLRWLFKAGLRRFVMLPLLINTILFSIGIWWSVSRFEHLDQAVQAWLPAWLAWLHGLLWPLFILTVLAATVYAFTVVANVIAAPFNGLLAARVERMIAPAGVPPRPTPEPTWQELLLSPLGELNKLLYCIGWAIPLVLLSSLSFFVPVIAPAVSVLWWLFGAWMLTLEYADYPLSRRGLTFREQRRLLRRHWPPALGFGGAVLLLTLIPVLNFLAMPAAVIGATLLWNREAPEL